MVARGVKARRGETHQPLTAWDPMPTDPLTLVVHAFAQAFMAKELEETRKQIEYQKMRLDVNKSTRQHISTSVMLATSVRQPRDQGSQVS